MPDSLDRPVVMKEGAAVLGVLRGQKEWILVWKSGVYMLLALLIQVRLPGVGGTTSCVHALHTLLF